MTDFLSRLVERSSGRAAVAHPVVAPLFAAGPALAADPGGNESWGEVPAAAAQPGPPAEPALVAPARTHAPQAAPSEAPRPVTLPGPIHVRAVAVEGPRTVERRAERAAAQDDGRPPKSVPAPAVEPVLPPASGVAQLVALPARAAVSFARRTPAPPDAAGVAPIVRISIGRIDVRAVTPPKPAAPAAPPARKEETVSLEEYLRPPRR